MSDTLPTGEQLARVFHETYERMAPYYGYETRIGTREFDPLTINGKLMIATCEEVLRPFVSALSEERSARQRLAAWMIASGFTTGHGDTLDDLLNELGVQVAELRALHANAEQLRQVVFDVVKWNEAYKEPLLGPIALIDRARAALAKEAPK